MSLSMNPLKQGLKLPVRLFQMRLSHVFIHESIKTRVETPIAISYAIAYERLYP